MPWLYFLRHGIADQDGVDPGLSTEGARLMRLEAQGMARLGLQFDLILTSPLQRTRQTAEIVAEQYGMSGRVSQLDGLKPGCRLTALAGLGKNEKSILLVGHSFMAGASLSIRRCSGPRRPSLLPRTRH